MPAYPLKKKLIIVADDLTGANDTGVPFSKAGFKVDVIFDVKSLADKIEQTDILVLDLESRFETKEQAYERCYELGKQLRQTGDSIVYKKIDSTFRGNIGAEIDGLMDSMQLTLAILAPALPASGRTTVNGDVYVHDVKLADTEFANDPRTPVRLSAIKDIIAMQSNRQCELVGRHLLREPPQLLGDKIRQTIMQESKILIFDSQTEDDLLHIAQLLAMLTELPILIAGSAGLATFLPKDLFRKREPLAFVFSGTVSEQTRAQINYAADHGLCGVYLITASDLLSDKYNPDALKDALQQDINKGINKFIITSVLSRQDVDQVFSLAAGRGWSNDTAAEMVALRMGEIAALLIAQFKPAGVLLTGGDTAIKTIRALHATGFSVDREIVPDIVSGTLTGIDLATIIATKSGGFGATDAIWKTLEFFTSSKIPGDNGREALDK